MSSLASLFNVPSTPEELATWSAAHQAHHRDINRRIYEILAINLPEFILDPLDPKNAEIWQDQHQIMHNNQNALLGISGFALTDATFTDTNSFSGWVYLNSVEHYQAANILEIG